MNNTLLLSKHSFCFFLPLVETGPKFGYDTKRRNLDPGSFIITEQMYR